jgi:YHS domain-containing protein
MVVLVSVLLLGAVACESSAGRGAVADPAGATTTAGLQRIADPGFVCMVNNQYMGKTQIPVEVGGKTYFGCCENCKAKLRDDPQARTAQDPVTGEDVDKASALLAHDASGQVLYFANEGTYRRYVTSRP